MVRQRLFAINDARTPYALLLDDDVEFEPQYIEKMFATIKNTKAQCCILILKDASKNSSILKQIVNRFIGCEKHKDTHDDFYENQYLWRICCKQKIITKSSVLQLDRSRFKLFCRNSGVTRHPL